MPTVVPRSTERGGTFSARTGRSVCLRAVLKPASQTREGSRGFSLRRVGDEGHGGWRHRRVRHTQVHGQGEDVSLLLRIQATERDRGRIGTSRAIRAGWGGAVRGRPRPTARPSLQEQVPAPIFRPFFVSFPSASWISAPPCFTPRPWTQSPRRRQPALPRAPAPFQLAASRLCSKRPRITRPLTGTVRALSPPPRPPGAESLDSSSRTALARITLLRGLNSAPGRSV